MQAVIILLLSLGLGIHKLFKQEQLCSWLELIKQPRGICQLINSLMMERNFYKKAQLDTLVSTQVSHFFTFLKKIGKILLTHFQQNKLKQNVCINLLQDFLGLIVNGIIHVAQFLQIYIKIFQLEFMMLQALCNSSSIFKIYLSHILTSEEMIHNVLLVYSKPDQLMTPQKVQQTGSLVQPLWTNITQSLIIQSIQIPLTKILKLVSDLKMKML